MREIVPQLIEQNIPPTTSSQTEQAPSGTSSASGIKRSIEPTTEEVQEPPTARPRVEEHFLVESHACDEALSVQDCQQLGALWDRTQNVEVLVAAYLQKRASKEIPASDSKSWLTPPNL